MNDLAVLYEDNHLLVIDKPAGLATMGAEPGIVTAHSLACDYLRYKYDKPGRVFVGVVSRLDSMTSGVLCLARTSKSASRLTPQFAEKSDGGAIKVYLAVVEGDFVGESGGDQGRLIDHVRKDDAAKRMRIVRPSADSLEATLRYVVLGRTGRETVLAVQLISGRKHQIRVQFADRGHPVIGDRKYDSRRSLTDPIGGGPAGVALHSWQLQIEHPTLKSAMRFSAPPPPSWKPWATALGDPRLGLVSVVDSFQLPFENL